MASQGDLLHHEFTNLSRLAGFGVRRAGTVGLLTNAQVVAANNAEELEAIALVTPGTVHAEYDFEGIETDRSLKFGKAIGDFTDTRVQAATSYEDLAEKTYAADGDLGQLGPRIV